MYAYFESSAHCVMADLYSWAIKTILNCFDAIPMFVAISGTTWVIYPPPASFACKLFQFVLYVLELYRFCHSQLKTFRCPPKPRASLEIGFDSLGGQNYNLCSKSLIKILNFTSFLCTIISSFQKYLNFPALKAS